MKNTKHSHRMGGKLDTEWSGPYIIDKKLSKGFGLRSHWLHIEEVIQLKEYVKPG